MLNLTLMTSGSTGEPKVVNHLEEDLYLYRQRAAMCVGLTSRDRVLNVLPAHTIGYQVVTGGAAEYSGAELLSIAFDPYLWLKMFKDFQPTYTVLIPRHIDILSKTKQWNNIDLRSLRYVVTGSQPVTQWHIDQLLARGVGHVGNWYGMTEYPPPVLIGHNSTQFDLNQTHGHRVEFTREGECVIDGHRTGDLFDVSNRTFLRRKVEPAGQTWKTDPK